MNYSIIFIIVGVILVGWGFFVATRGSVKNSVIGSLKTGWRGYREKKKEPKK